LEECTEFSLHSNIFYNYHAQGLVYIQIYSTTITNEKNVDIPLKHHHDL